MKKVRKALNNKNGFSYIPVCIFTLIVVMVIGILMQYMPKKDLANSKVPASLLRFREQNPSVKKVILHFDNEPPGRLAAKGITAALSGRCEVKYVPPPREKDFNAYLCVMKAEEIRVGKRRDERA